MRKTKVQKDGVILLLLQFGFRRMCSVAGQIFEYYSNAGVDISFAAETLKTPNDAMWYPNRDELTKAGIITYISSATVRPRIRPLQPKIANKTLM